MGHHLRDRTWGSYKWSEKKKKGLILSRIERVSKSLLPNLCLLLLFCRLFRAYFHLCHFVVFFFRYICFFYDSCQRIIWPLQIKLSWFFCFARKLTLSILNISALIMMESFQSHRAKNKTEKNSITYKIKATATAQPRMAFFNHCRVWPCSNNAGKTTWRRSNSKDNSLTGTSLHVQNTSTIEVPFNNNKNLIFLERCNLRFLFRRDWATIRVLEAEHITFRT